MIKDMDIYFIGHGSVYSVLYILWRDSLGESSIDDHKHENVYWPQKRVFSYKPFCDVILSACLIDDHRYLNVAVHGSV